MLYQFLISLEKCSDIKFIKKDLKIKSGTVDMLTIDNDNIPTLIFSEPSFSKQTILKMLQVHHELIDNFTSAKDFMTNPSIIYWGRAKSLCLTMDPNQDDMDYIMTHKLPIEIRKYDAPIPPVITLNKTEVVKAFLKNPTSQNFQRMQKL